MLIDCDTCAVRGDACSECVIAVLLRRPPVGIPVSLDAAEAAAIGSLAGAGMVPPLQLVPVVPAAGWACGDTPGKDGEPDTADSVTCRPDRTAATAISRSRGIA